VRREIKKKTKQEKNKFFWVRHRARVMGGHFHRSHFLGAVYGMEAHDGARDTPVRRVLNSPADHFAQQLPIVYVQTW